MNILEKLNTLLTKDGRTIKYGDVGNESADPVVGLSIGESMPVKAHLGDKDAIKYPTVLVTVASADYMSGFILIETLKDEIEAAIKDTVKIVFYKDFASEQKGAKYIFKSQFKQLV